MLRSLNRITKAYWRPIVYLTLALLANLGTVSVRANSQMCYSLFYQSVEIRGIHPKLYSRLNEEFSNQAFLEQILSLLAKEGLHLTRSGTLIEMLHEAALHVDTNPDFEFKTSQQKTVIWNRLSNLILNLLSVELERKTTSGQPKVEIQFPLFMVLTSLGYRFESIAFNDQHLNTTESKKARELLASHPAVKRKYSQSNVISINSNPAKSLDEIPTVEEHGHTTARPRTMKVASMNPVLRDTLLEVYNFMQEIPEFENYAAKLYLDAAMMTKKNSDENPNLNRLFGKPDLQSGKLSPEIGLKVLLYRFIRWGIPIHPIFDGYISNPEFQEILRSGSTILDFGILEKVPQHGYASHLIQHDYILTRLTERHGHDLAVSKMRILLQFFATPDGIGFWSDIFDSFVLGRLNSPIVLNHEITRWLNGFTRDVSQFD